MLNVLLEFPNISPNAIEIWGFGIRWYSLAYIGGLILGWWFVRQMNKQTKALDAKQYDDILTWAIFGVILGGRLGYVLFYKPIEYLHDPVRILHIWEGGMSFHGGMIGMVLAMYLFCRSRKIRFFPVMDMVAVTAPIGLFFGRLANFINGELYGRVTDSPLGMVFPADPLQLPRHPSQLYEAALEGLVLGIMLYISFRLGMWKRAKFNSGLFLVGYGVFRSISELFREPDKHLGYIIEGITMGQLLSAPMILLGIYLLITSKPTTELETKEVSEKWQKKKLKRKKKK